MGRMHAPGKGLSQSALPYRRSVPTWLKLTSDDVKEQIFKLAKKGLTPSQIGVILRDSHGVAQVRFVTGNKILRILKSKGLARICPRTCTTSSRRLWPSASTWRGKEVRDHESAGFNTGEEQEGERPMRAQDSNTWRGTGR
uniref:Small ribosomal subunit protein uS15 n=1 Tax=Neogobius melanostomus TaxID=47308 RepID=A0A8C6WUS4_9GOBI